MLLKVPETVTDSESKKYKVIVEEQKPIIVNTDTLGRISKKLIQLDGLYSSAPDEMAKATARTQLVEIESRINGLMSHFAGLSAGLAEDQNKSLSNAIATLSQALVTYRQTIMELRRTLDSKGIDMQVLNDMRSQINMKDLEIKGLERQLMAGGGGGGSDPSVKELQTKLSLANRELDGYRKGAGADDRSAAIKRELEDCLARGSVGVSYREWLRFAEGEGYYQLLKQGNLKRSERQLFADQARQIFEGLQLSTTNKEMKGKASERLGDLRKN